MDYRIVVDSCGELPDNLKEDGHFKSVPLEMFVDDQRFVDDETFDQGEFLKQVAASADCPRSACPSPERYMDAYECEAQRVYVVTLSAELSGSYSSAELGRTLYLEEKGEKDIHVFNSKTASVGETLVAMKIQECEEAGMDFQDVVRTVEEYIAEMDTYFVLENLEILRKNGRLSALKAIVAGALNIKPVLGSTDEGTICQLGQARGMNRALDKMLEIMLSKVKNAEDKVLAISHCNCPKRAKSVVERVQKMAHFKDIFVIDTGGISTMYASDGGIIMCI